MRNILKNKKGFILISTYMIISVVSIFSFAFFAREATFLQATERNLNKITAFNMAEAGVDFALAQLVQDITYTGTPGYMALDTTSNQGGYEVAVTTPADNTTIRIIQATGYAPTNDNTGRAYEEATITAYGQITSSLFEHAVFTNDDMRIKGSATIDSYDSNNAPYDPTNPGEEGDIGTNSIANDAMRLSGSVTVWGDAAVGPTGDPEDVIRIDGTARIEGDTSAASEPRDLEVITTTVVSSGDLEVSGSSDFFLSEGTHHYDSIKISESARIIALGPVSIFVDGEVKISGSGIVTQDNTPANFLLYVTGNEDVKLSGSSDFFGAIYAPNSYVRKSGSGELYGAIVADSYKQSGSSKLHYDEALQEVEGGGGNVTLALLAWEESSTVTWGTGG